MVTLMVNLKTGIIKTKQGNTIENISSQLGLHQLINEPRHRLQNSSSRVDLIFTPQSNLVLEPGVSSSLHSSCYHQIVFAKFISNI